MADAAGKQSPDRRRLRQNAQLADDPAQPATGDDDRKADTQKQRPLLQKRVKNRARQDTSDHAADDCLG
jgi:hypothetical protein